MKVSTLLVLSYTAYADNVLYLTNLTCDESYPVSVSDVSFSCAEGCSFGSTGSFQSSLVYSNLGVEDLYTTALMNFTAFTNESAYTMEVTDAGFSQQMFFGSMIDLCANYADDESCSLDGGNFSAAFEYSIPSAGDLNEYFAGYTVQSKVKVYDYYNNMGVLGECLASFTTEAPIVEATTYQTVASNTAYFFAAAAAAAIALVYLLPKSNNTTDEKKVDLINKTFSDDNDPDVIERERSVFKGLSKPSYDGGYDFDPEVLSPVHEEMDKSVVSEQIVTEEIPWPSKDDVYDAPDAPISEITHDIITEAPIEKIPSKEEVVAIVENNTEGRLV